MAALNQSSADKNECWPKETLMATTRKISSPRATSRVFPQKSYFSNVTFNIYSVIALLPAPSFHLGLIIRAGLPTTVHPSGTSIKTNPSNLFGQWPRSIVPSGRGVVGSDGGQLARGSESETISNTFQSLRETKSCEVFLYSNKAALRRLTLSHM